ncbi:hypothetical protein D0Z03_001903 [Geotrichum reessii]|nr:hypothetical protein D0Z03_001903 [Galactomyces reessii]
MNNQGHYQMHGLPAVQGQATTSTAAAGHIPQQTSQQQQQAESYPGYAARQQTVEVNGNGIETSMSQLHAAANGNRAGQIETRRPGDPVEFNQAISYVNKIKTRFSSQPEIYKTFLEILQTYQREQLRITEVYEQVTQLFQEAPDLLDDFRQFLPDMSQQQRSVGIVPTENNVRLPPVGNFAPPLSGANVIPEQNLPTPSIPSLNNQPAAAPALTLGPRTKKKAGGQDNQFSGQYDNSNIAVSSVRGPPTKKSKTINGTVSPSLVPATPEPLLTQKSGALLEEISFFDKAKKYISNKQTYNEFLKVLNLFSQRIIDKSILVDRVNGFLGGSDELMSWFKAFVKYEGKPLHIENITYKKHLLELSRCKAYGKSYRLLPKSETYMPCSGRDEMCWEVLNDEWVGHPTWASEEAGFVAHRKNQYEEIMHRCEEERLEYDYFIEANLRSIQTLETLNSRIASMTQEEKVLFKLPPNLGHTSTIYAKVLKKIYGEPRYHEVVDALMETPATSVPIVLKRMKQKDEEWRRAHREWNKVWRDTEQKVFYKSLDHRGLTFKQTDKKNLTTRQLVSEIITVKTEQTNKRLNPLTPKPKDQLVYYVKDNDVLVDMYKLVLIFLEHSNSYSHNDRERMIPFFRTFLVLFFSLPEDLLDVPEKNEEEEENVDSAADSTSVSKRSREDIDHLRDFLKKSKHARIEKHREEEKNDEEKSKEEEAFEEIEKAGELWLRHINASSTGDLFEQRPRHTFNLFANSTVYVFFRLINILYERLKEVKSYEAIVSKEIAGNRGVQFAKDLELYDKRLEEMGLEFDKDDCYGQLLKLIEKLIEGDLEHQWYEESIRQAYRNRAYKLYTVDKVLQAIVKHLHTIVSDAKSSDVLVLFERDRLQLMSNVKEQILYRMRVNSVLGLDENMFRIEWDDKEKRAIIQFLGYNDITLKQTKTDEEKWNYYLTSYLMTNPTEGVPVDKVQLPFMHRNITEDNEAEDLFGAIEQGLTARVCDSTYKLFFEANSEDFFSRKIGATAEESTKTALEQQKTKFHEFLDGAHGWKGELNEDATATAEEKFKIWAVSGPDALRDWKPKVREFESKAESEVGKTKETIVMEHDKADVKEVEPALDSNTEAIKVIEEKKSDDQITAASEEATAVNDDKPEKEITEVFSEEAPAAVVEDVEMPDADTVDVERESTKISEQPVETIGAAEDEKKEERGDKNMISTPVVVDEAEAGPNAVSESNNAAVEPNVDATKTPVATEALAEEQKSSNPEDLDAKNSSTVHADVVVFEKEVPATDEEKSTEVKNDSEPVTTTADVSTEPETTADFHDKVDADSNVEINAKADDVSHADSKIHSDADANLKDAEIPIESNLGSDADASNDIKVAPIESETDAKIDVVSDINTEVDTKSETKIASEVDAKANSDTKADTTLVDNAEKPEDVEMSD